MTNTRKIPQTWVWQPQKGESPSWVPVEGLMESPQWTAQILVFLFLIFLFEIISRNTFHSRLSCRRYDDTPLEHPKTIKPGGWDYNLPKSWGWVNWVRSKWRPAQPSRFWSNRTMRTIAALSKLTWRCSPDDLIAGGLEQLLTVSDMLRDGTCKSLCCSLVGSEFWQKVEGLQTWVLESANSVRPPHFHNVFWCFCLIIFDCLYS